MSGVKLSLLRDAVFARPFSVRAGHAASTNLCKFCSAFGAGSVATTSNPRARNSDAQLAPITPVPTIAIFFIGLLIAIVVLHANSVSSNGKRLDEVLLLGVFERIKLSCRYCKRAVVSCRRDLRNISTKE